MTGRDRPGGFLDRVYGLEGPAATQALYRDWAASYEAEIAANGYATPARCAAALAAAAADRTAPVLDLGCGTGLSGVALRAAGFVAVDGTDFTPAMLAVARDKGIYRRLIPGDLTRPLPGEPGDYAHMVAVGVLNPGHAPAGLIGTAVARLPPGGCFVFSLNDHALADPSFRAEIARLAAADMAETVADDYGDHLPGQGLNAAVVVLRRV